MKEKRMSETLSVTPVYEGPVFTVTKEEFVAGERHCTFDIVRKREVVAIVAVDPKDPQAILLGRQYRHPTGAANLGLFAGIVDPGETPQEAAHRELAEESGYEAGTLFSLGSFYSSPGWTDELMHVFLADQLFPSEQPRDLEEGIEVISLRVDSLLAEARNVQNGHLLAGLLLALPYLPE